MYMKILGGKVSTKKNKGQKSPLKKRLFPQNVLIFLGMPKGYHGVNPKRASQYSILSVFSSQRRNALRACSLIIGRAMMRRCSGERASSS